MNVTGSIDLLKLTGAKYVGINGVNHIIIPVVDNDLYISKDEDGAAKGAYLGLNINERREPTQYGKTHYCKQQLSKGFKEEQAQLAEDKGKVYLGDFKTFEYSSNVPQPTEQVAIDSPVVDGYSQPVQGQQPEEQGLPF